MSLENLLGKTVIKKSDSGAPENVNVADLTADDTTIGLYFSAHWCPPCRGFTPVLAQFYNKVKEQGKKLEIIFISSDRDQASFDDYFNKEMPWHALPFSDRDTKKKLCETFGVSGIPTFIILNKDGTAKIKGARSNVMDDPDGEEFPWAE